MVNSRIIKNTGVCLLIGGVITSGAGIYLRNQAQGMVKTLKDGGKLFGYDSGTYRAIDIWEGKVNNATMILVAGALVLAIGMIMIYTGFLRANANKHPELKGSNQDITARIIKLNEAKEAGLITDEEYEIKRKEIINNL